MTMVPMMQKHYINAIGFCTRAPKKNYYNQKSQSVDARNQFFHSIQKITMKSCLRRSELQDKEEHLKGRYT